MDQNPNVDADPAAARGNANRAGHARRRRRGAHVALGRGGRFRLNRPAGPPQRRGPFPPGDGVNMYHFLPVLRREDVYTVGEEQVSFQEILDHERENGITDKWYFENVKSYQMSPEEDFETCINTHAKISLRAGEIYTVTKTVRIQSACYVIGNAAIIKIKMPEGGPAFDVCARTPIPAIGFMERVCFSDVVFESLKGSTAVCCVSENSILFHGCAFIGPHMLCLDLRGGGEIRGCQFINAVCAIRTKGIFSLMIKHSIFEKCAFGAVTNGKANVLHCTFVDCACSLRLGGAGHISYCYFAVNDGDSPPMHLKLCTCEGQGAHVSPLGNLHFASNKEAPWPKFTHNTLNRVRLYMGKRRGVFYPKYCMMALSMVVAPRGVAQRICLYSCYDSTSLVVQRVQFEREREDNERLCTCGDKHITPVMHTAYVSDMRINREVNSYETVEFSSTDEEEY
ncbi:E1B 50.5kDa protein [Skunk adenovirus 1]|uniref:E1B 50.5kDa protein n=1 Tax=Skunk adenovirus 1 TaxID=2698728 RepID=A0A0K0MGF7_9ADEN|nr:E1B 50.5kDa protein [Skunk adenovirus PB1]AKC34839.1 E1B 50.5kDa protein [Skunk adenovirus PB1]UKT59817.1 E1B 50.5kDa protein [Raccoon adenovirus]UKT59847.1 E1B 50.5kDa protein [Porcupine adenovirus]